jgi:hypothetical protein
MLTEISREKHTFEYGGIQSYLFVTKQETCCAMVKGPMGGFLNQGRSRFLV